MNQYPIQCDMIYQIPTFLVVLGIYVTLAFHFMLSKHIYLLLLLLLLEQKLINKLLGMNNYNTKLYIILII